MITQQVDYDIIIVGAGIVGLTLACGLQDKGLRIAILDQIIPFNEKAELKAKAHRVSAITLGSQHILENYKVWQHLPKSTLSFFDCIQVWEQGSASNLVFESAELGQSHLGTILSNRDLQIALLKQLKKVIKINCFFSEPLTAIQYTQSFPIVTLASGKSFTTKLVVGADGAKSSVRQLAGIGLKYEHDYYQEALVSTVRSTEPHKNTARQIFLPTGPLAFLPLVDPYLSSIVWSTTLNEAKKLKELSELNFNLALTTFFEKRLGDIVSSTMRLSFPLKTQQCERYIAEGIVLIGDAAHTIHPLAGQGVNLGIADAYCLTNILLNAHQKQRTLGALHTLRRYERERRFYRRLMGIGIDVIQKTFAAKHSFLVNTRHAGINFIEKNSWMKKKIMHYAMGDNPFTGF